MSRQPLANATHLLRPFQMSRGGIRGPPEVTKTILCGFTLLCTDGVGLESPFGPSGVRAYALAQGSIQEEGGESNGHVAAIPAAAG